MKAITLFILGMACAFGSVGWEAHGGSLEECLLFLGAGGALMYGSLFLVKWL